MTSEVQVKISIGIANHFQKIANRIPGEIPEKNPWCILGRIKRKFVRRVQWIISKRVPERIIGKNRISVKVWDKRLERF